MRGIDSPFETVGDAGLEGPARVVAFAGDVFALSGYSNNGSFGIRVQVSDVAGPQGSVELLGCCLVNPGPGQPALGPNRDFGAHVRGENLSEVRLLVRAGPG